MDSIVKIKILNEEDGWVNFWTLEKFEERLELMRELLDDFFNYNMVLEDGQTDPFWDPKELLLMGRGFCMLKNNIYRFSLDQKISILGHDGHIGFINATFIPVDEKDNVIEDEELEELV